MVVANQTVVLKLSPTYRTLYIWGGGVDLPLSPTFFSLGSSPPLWYTYYHEQDFNTPWKTNSLWCISSTCGCEFQCFFPQCNFRNLRHL